MHVGLFAGFGLLWMHATRRSLRRGIGRVVVGRVVVGGIIFAAATEAGQGLLPFGRTASFLDGLADAAGLLLGVAAFYGGGRLPISSSASDAHEKKAS